MRSPEDWLTHWGIKDTDKIGMSLLSSTLKVMVENVQEEAYRIAAKDIIMNVAQVGEVLRLERFPGFPKEKPHEE